MRGTVRPMRKPGFSLSKITNLASCLMTVLLALNLHSLAAQISTPSAQSEEPSSKSRGASPHGTGAKAAPVTPAPAGVKAPESLRPSKQRLFMNHLQGWTPANGLADDDPATGQVDEEQPDSRVRLAEQGLSGELATHRRAVQGQEESFQQQQKALEQQQKELDEKLQALGRNASELSAQQEQRRQDVEQSIARLAHIYEQMPPRDAAAMFNILDMRVLVPVAQHMIPRRISDVIGNMQPDRANILSQYLAGIRKLSPDTINRMNSPIDSNIAP